MNSFGLWLNRARIPCSNYIITGNKLRLLSKSLPRIFPSIYAFRLLIMIAYQS